MLLAINANNTNVKFSVYDGEKALGDWRIRTESSRTADEYVVWVSQLMALAGLKVGDITDAIIATVVPQTLFNLRMLCERHLKAVPLIVGDPAVALGIEVLMEMPTREVGADRLARNTAGRRSSSTSAPPRPSMSSTARATIAAASSRPESI